jgi:hypothetical protein
MKQIQCYLFLLFLFVAIPCPRGYSLPCGNIPEIPNTQIHDIAMATWYQGQLPNGNFYTGPVIIFNPQVTSSVSYDLNAFFRTHEHSHICLGHVIPSWQNYSLPPVMSQSRELETDAYAARQLIKHNQINPVKAAFSRFLSQGQNMASPRHPPGFIRAQNIRNVAASMGVNIQ